MAFLVVAIIAVLVFIAVGGASSSRGKFTSKDYERSARMLEEAAIEEARIAAIYDAQRASQLEERELKGPSSLEEFINQRAVVDPVKTMIDAVRNTGEYRYLRHLLFVGVGGTGKTTLAHIVGRELDMRVVGTVGPKLRTIPDILDALRLICEAMQDGKVPIWFIDEIHAMVGKESVVMDYLKPLLEEQVVYTEEELPHYLSRDSTKVVLPYFPIIGATTDQRKLDQALRSRFVAMPFREYSAKHLVDIGMLHASKLNVPAAREALQLLTKYVSIPRELVNLVLDAETILAARQLPEVTPEVSRAVVEQRRLLPGGVTPTGIAILKVLQQGGQAKSRLASMTGSTKDDVEDALECLFKARLATVGHKHCITEKGKTYLEQYG